MRPLLLLALASCAGPSAWEPVEVVQLPLPEVDHPRAGALQAVVDHWVGEGFVGAVGLVDGPEGFWVGAGGYAVVEADQAMTPWHVLHSASVAKLYVAADAMRVVEEGRLDLDERLAAYLPDLAADLDHGEEITVRQLMNHTSGVYDYFSNPGFFMAYIADPTHPWTVDEFLDILTSHRARFEPGTDWGYSNSNYLLLSLVLDEITGDHAAHLAAEILDPAGLEHTWYKTQAGYPRPPGLVNSYADLYGDGRMINLTDVYALRYGAMQGDDGLMATALDYGAFVRDLFSGEVVGPGSLDAMAAWEETGLEGLSYGLGVIRDERGPSVAVGHSGSTDASGAEVFWFPEAETAVVLLVNSGLNEPWATWFSDGFWPELVEEAVGAGR